MKRAVIWIVVLLIIFVVAPYVFLRMGFLNMSADQTPPGIETVVASSFLDASTGRHAPDVKNPLQPTDATLMAGMKLYREKCSMCHGAPDHPERSFGYPLYPPAPHFLKDPADNPENWNFYTIQRGVRWTGMPAWGHTLSDTQIWQLVTFLHEMDKLPPAVKTVWEKPAPVGTEHGWRPEPGAAAPVTPSLQPGQ